jgi:hypothetical protein
MCLPAAADVGYAANGERGWFSTFRVPFGGLEVQVPQPYSFSGLAISPAGELFGVTTPFPRSGDPPRLARIDPLGSKTEIVGTLAIPTTGDFPEDFGLAFDGLGRLWLATSEGKLYEVDPSSGAVIPRADLGMRLAGLAGCGASLLSLTYPPSTRVPVHLVRIDPEVESSVVVGPGFSSGAADGGAGLDFSSDGRLWGVLRSAENTSLPLSSQVELDPLTGELLDFRPMYTGDWVHALALAPPPPICPGRGVAEVPSTSAVGLAALASLLALAAGVKLHRGRLTR